MTKPRFYIIETHGWEITPAAGGGHRKAAGGTAPTVISILDRPWAHREVRRSKPGTGGDSSYTARRTRMERICAELNSWHDATA